MSTVRKIVRALPRAAADPVTAAKLFRRRIIPYGLQTKDHESYRLASWSYGNLPRVEITDIMPGIETVGEVSLQFPLLRTQDLSIDVIELSYLLSIAKFTNAKQVLEVGTWDGNTTLNIAANLPEGGRVTTLDLPPDATGAVVLPISAMLNNMTDRSKLGIRYKNTPHESKVNQVYGDSATLDWKSLPGPFDLMFIDGCHAYPYVKSDSESALSALADGGTLVWHDYGMIEDVSKYVDQLSAKLLIKIIKRTRMAIAYKVSASARDAALAYSQKNIAAAGK